MKLIEIEEKKGLNPHLAHVSLKQYHSVEFSVDGLYFLYQFKIQSLSESSIGVLIRENSEIMGLLKVGDIIKMKYYPKDAFFPAELLDTEIQYITKEEQGRFQGHYLIGLALLAQAPLNTFTSIENFLSK
jgi:hypothetical protein